MNQQPLNQLSADGKLKHFLDIEGLNHSVLTSILDTAESFINVGEREVKKVPLLRGKTIANVFFEASTRTRTTFELAQKRLSADILNININESSTKKGESLIDTLQNLKAMHCDMFVVRHQHSGAALFLAQHIGRDVPIINAGDGQHAHPTQAMLDMFTIRKHCADFPNLTVAIVGDIAHSRVARSQILALNLLRCGEVRVVGPKTLIPKHIESLGVNVFHDLKSGLAKADVVIMLRLQKERMKNATLPSEHEYYQSYGLTTETLEYAKESAVVLHPGPINRGVEISSEVADGEQSLILNQVSYGIAVRMAVMSMAMHSRNKD